LGLVQSSLRGTAGRCRVLERESVLEEQFVLVIESKRSDLKYAGLFIKDRQHYLIVYVFFIGKLTHLQHTPSLTTVLGLLKAVKTQL